MSQTKFIFMALLLVLTASKSPAADPTLARLSFWLPPERLVEFEGVYTEEVTPHLKRHGLVESAQKSRTTVDSVFCRLFEFETRSELVQKQKALGEDPAVQQLFRDLGSKFGTAGPDRLIRHRFGFYIAPAGPGKPVTAPEQVVQSGPGKGSWQTFDWSDGLGVGRISSIVQDRAGALWFSTERGTSRYDGQTWITYSTEDGLPPGRVSPEFLDRDGHLWFSNRRGVSRYDGHGFTTFTLKEGLMHNYVRSMIQDREGRLWFTTTGGVSRLDGQTWTTFTIEDGLPDNNAEEILQDQEGNIWISIRDHGVTRYDGKTFTTFTEEEGLMHNYVRSMIQDREGRFWFTTSEGVSRFDGQIWTIFTIEDGLPGNNAQEIFQDQRGNIWISMREPGVSRYDGKTFTTFTQEEGLADSNVLSIFEDRKGHLWFRTWNGGVSRYDGQRFTTFSTESGLAHNSVNSIFEDGEGYLWFGTRNGSVSRYDGQTFTTYTAENGAVGDDNIWSILTDREGRLWFNPLASTRGSRGDLSSYNGQNWKTFLSRGEVTPERFLLQDRKGNLWFLDLWEGVIRYDGQTFVVFTESEGLVSKYVMWGLEDREGNIWFGTWDGVSRYDGQTFTNFTTEDGLAHNRVNRILQDRNGVFWFATSRGGINRYDGQVFTTLTTKDGLADNSIWSMMEDREGHLWFGTRGGVSRYDGQTFTTFTTDEGLAGNDVRSVFQDRKGHYWFVTSDGGVSRFDGQVFQTLDVRDGLPSRWVRWIAEDGEGTLWFATDSGVVHYRQPPQSPSPVFIDAVVADRRYEETSSVSIPTSAQLTTFEFHAISLKTSPGAMIYRYRLKGFEDWQTTRKGRVEYQDLPRGTYTFEVQAVDRDLVYSETPATVALTVHLPYERIGWVSALGVALVLIGWQTVRVIRRDRRLRESNAALSAANRDLFGVNRDLESRTEELEVARDTAEAANRDLTDRTEELEVARDAAEAANRAKSQFLANMSHELRTPLNGILGYTQILTRNRNLDRTQQGGVDVIRRSGEHLLTLIEDLLDLARIEAQKVDLEESTFHLPVFLKDIGEMMGLRAEQKGVSFVYEPLSELPEYVVGDERRLRQVLINLLGNAVKFTPQGQVTLKVEVLNRDRLRFEVVDTGEGIPVEKQADIFKPFEQLEGVARQEGTGLGLAISQQFLGLMGSEIQVESTLGEGSRFWFEVDLLSAEVVGASEETVERIPLGFEGTSKKVLVVDDTPGNRQVLVDVLTPLGFDVVEEADGKAGLEKAADWMPDLILMDLVMPTLDGFEAIRQIRQDEALKAMKVFALSASVFEEDQQRSLEAGYDNFVGKPANVRELLEKIGSHLELEWVYGEDPVESKEAVDGEMTVPPPEALTELFDLAQKGRIVGVREEIDRIEQMGDVYGVFVEELHDLAKGFKLKEIRTFLEPYMDEPSEET